MRIFISTEEFMKFAKNIQDIAEGKGIKKGPPVVPGDTVSVRFKESGQELIMEIR